MMRRNKAPWILLGAVWMTTAACGPGVIATGDDDRGVLATPPVSARQYPPMEALAYAGPMKRARLACVTEAALDPQVVVPSALRDTLCEVAELQADDGSYYALSGVLGGGSFSAFRMAVDAAGQAWAVKEVPIAPAGADAASGFLIATTVEAFRLELGLLGFVAHDVLEIHEVLQTTDRIYAVLTLLQGPSTYLKGADKRAVSDLLRQGALQVAQDAARLHSVGFVHNDLRPANFLWHDSGRVLLSDYGMAARLDENGVLERAPYQLREKLGRGALVNEVMAAPEVRAGVYGTEADTWSLGMSLVQSTLSQWWMLEGIVEVATNPTAFREFRAGLVRGGKIDASRLQDPASADVPLRHWYFNALFYDLREVDSVLCQLVLEGMLVPDPEERLDMAGVVARLEPLVGADVQRRVAARLADVARVARQEQDTHLQPLRDRLAARRS
jgi:serine/threonine protein kinase